jgi:ABC-type polysaccharide/polyol phosphate transport system ATPase subunit
VTAIHLDGVSKRYWKVKERTLLSSMRQLMRQDRTELWALRDVDLTLERGETIGMIGRNGAGKSTLLRLLAGVSQPTAGRMVTRGRTVPLLSVGVGFHQEMTGRENVYVNGMLLGLSRQEVASRFDEIVAFAELDEFIDTPVKFYSSGMFMRLGFAVAIHVDPDILLVDEVLAVGDVGFQLRCFERMRDLQHSGTTIVFVSHSMQAIHLLCPRTVVMHRGRVAFDGETETGVARYHELLLEPDEPSSESSAVTLVERQLLADGAPVEAVQQDQVLTYRAVLRFHQEVSDPQVVFRVLTGDGTLAYHMGTVAGDRWRTYAPGDEAVVETTFEPRFGGGGTFRVALYVAANDSKTMLFGDPNGPSFFVPPQLGVGGIADLRATITVDGLPRTDHPSLRFGSGMSAMDTI